MQKAGFFISTDWRQPAMTVTTLTVQTVKTRIEGGAPFAETAETPEGLFVVAVPDPDAAIASAGKRLAA